MDSFTHCGISPTDADYMLQVLVALLHLGNLQFQTTSEFQQNLSTEESNPTVRSADTVQSKDKNNSAVSPLPSGPNTPAATDWAGDGYGSVTDGVSEFHPPLLFSPSVQHHVAIACSLLGITDEQLLHCLTQRRKTIADREIHITLSAHAAHVALDSFLAYVYSQLLGWITSTINRAVTLKARLLCAHAVTALERGRFTSTSSIPFTARGGLLPPSFPTCSPTQDTPLQAENITVQGAIGLLDLYGYESRVANNTFSTLCTNYVNEKVHFKYTKTLLVEFQTLLEKEGIEFSPEMSWQSNKDVVDLYENRSFGLLSLCEEALKLTHQQRRKGTLCDVIHQRCANRARFRSDKEKRADGIFSVAHYWGEVDYDLKAFLSTCRFEAVPEYVECLSSSCHPLLGLKRTFEEGDGDGDDVVDTVHDGNIRGSIDSTFSVALSAKSDFNDEDTVVVSPSGVTQSPPMVPSITLRPPVAHLLALGDDSIPTEAEGYITCTTDTCPVTPQDYIPVSEGGDQRLYEGGEGSDHVENISVIRASLSSLPSTTTASSIDTEYSGHETVRPHSLSLPDSHVAGPSPPLLRPQGRTSVPGRRWSVDGKAKVGAGDSAQVRRSIRSSYPNTTSTSQTRSNNQASERFPLSVPAPSLSPTYAMFTSRPAFAKHSSFTVNRSPQVTRETVSRVHALTPSNSLSLYIPSQARNRSESNSRLSLASTASSSSSRCGHCSRRFTASPEGKKKNIIAYVRDNVRDLTARIAESTVHFVYCIKPTTGEDEQEDAVGNRRWSFNQRVVASQLHSAHILEIARLHRHVLANHTSYREFVCRFYTAIGYICGGDSTRGLESSTRSHVRVLVRDLYDVIRRAQVTYGMNYWRVAAELLVRLIPCAEHVLNEVERSEGAYRVQNGRVDGITDKMRSNSLVTPSEATVRFGRTALFFSDSYICGVEDIVRRTHVLAARVVQLYWRGFRCGYTSKSTSSSVVVYRHAKTVLFLNKVVVFQRWLRVQLCKKRLRSAILSVTILTSLYRRHHWSKTWTQKRTLTLKLQSLWRGMVARRYVRRYQDAWSVLCTLLGPLLRLRRHRIQRNVMKSRDIEVKLAVRIQRNWRRVVARRAYLLKRSALIVLQRWVVRRGVRKSVGLEVCPVTTVGDRFRPGTESCVASRDVSRQDWDREEGSSRRFDTGITTSSSEPRAGAEVEYINQLPLTSLPPDTRGSDLVVMESASLLEELHLLRISNMSLQRENDDLRSRIRLYEDESGGVRAHRTPCGKNNIEVGEEEAQRLREGGDLFVRSNTLLQASDQDTVERGGSRACGTGAVVGSDSGNPLGIVKSEKGKGHFDRGEEERLQRECTVTTTAEVDSERELEEGRKGRR
eukprot:gene2135-2551_t